MRLFYALMPSDAMIEGLQDIMTGVAGARWQTAEQLHLTLRFIGDVSGATLDDLVAALPGRGLALPPVTLVGVGYFESGDRPDALWVRAMPKEPLAGLHRKLDHACQRIGLEPERRSYMPHITVARLSRSAGPVGGWIEEHAGFSLPGVSFARCSLVKSIMTKSGSHYEELASVQLARS